MGLEIFKGIMQLLLIVTIGGTVSFLVNNFQYRRELQKEHGLLMKEILHRLNKAYADTKRVRRLVRTKGHGFSLREDVFSGTISKDDYENQLLVLNDIQLELEDISKMVVEASNIIQAGDQISNNIRAMEKYLNGIVDEFERKLAYFSDSSPELAFRELPQLADLILPRRQAQFDGFVLEYSCARKLLQKEIFALLE
jgi:hypothetical protein